MIGAARVGMAWASLRSARVPMMWVSRLAGVAKRRIAGIVHRVRRLFRNRGFLFFFFFQNKNIGQWL